MEDRANSDNGNIGGVILYNTSSNLPLPANEPVLSYGPGSMEREMLQAELARIKGQMVDIPLIIGGKEIRTGNLGRCIEPHCHGSVLAQYHIAGEKEVQMAIDSALAAKTAWENLPCIERAKIFMRAAELLATKYRYTINAITMLNQSKNPYQAEIDSACEMIDFLRFNAYFMQELYKAQPLHSPTGILNTVEYRPLEGFVFAVSPFNFTSIGGNLASAPAIMGNVVVWKPAGTAVYAGYFLMKVFMEAGLPDGVINFIPGQGAMIGNIVLNSPDFAGIHFTGSTSVFQGMWQTIGNNIQKYKTYPRIVGETGGKDFMVVHNSAELPSVVAAMVRGAFEYQGQKCSALSRAYVPASLWPTIKSSLLNKLQKVKVGPVQDFSNFVNAVIDKSSFDNIKGYIDHARQSDKAEIIFGGHSDDSVGYFIEPTVIQAFDPQYRTMSEEIFGPVLTIYVYPDEQYQQTLELCDKTSIYALTGCVMARDRYAISQALSQLRHAAGNFYINDKPTGAVVGQQPFGGARSSGTNDKAGSMLNLERWTSVRLIKETFNPPTDFGYPFMK